MTAKMWIECGFMLLTACIVLFGALLVMTESFFQRRVFKGKLHNVIAVFVDCCFVGLNVGFVCFAALVPAWLIAVFIEWFERW